MSVEIALPDVQRVYLDRQWPDYQYPDHMEQKFPEPDSFVSWQCFQVEADVDQPAVAAAVAAVLAHHDTLRTRLVKRDGGWIQRIEGPGGPVPLEWIQAADGPATNEAFDRGLGSLSLGGGRILHCAYLRRGPAGGLLFLFYHHVMVDWVSAQILAEDLHTALAQTHRGRAIGLPPQTSSVAEWTERVERVLRSGEWEPELRRLTNHKRSWPPVALTSFPVEHRPGQPAGGEVDVTLAAEATTALLRSSPEARFLDLLQTALARTLAPWAGVPALPICVVVHGRDPIFPDLDLSRTVGSFAMGLLEVISPDQPPRRSPLADPRLRFAQVLLNFSRPLEMAYEGEGSDPYVSIYDRYNPQVSLNFHGRIEATPQSSALQPVSTEDWRDTRIRAVSRSLDCQVAIDRGRLRVTWKYSPQYYRRSTIERLAQVFLDELVKLRSR